MTSNCPTDYLRDSTISSFFSSGTELLPGLAGHTCHPAEMAEACISLIDLEEMEAVFRTAHGRLPAENFLSPDEIKRFAAFTYPKRRREWLGGRLACKMSVLELLRLPLAAEQFSAISILPAEHGAPRVAAPPAWSGALPSVSISHSGRYAVAMAAADTTCGVDIQQITARTGNVVDRFAQPGELRLLQDAMPDWNEARRLTLLWAAKEALKKSLLSDQPVFFQGISLQSVRRQRCILLRFTHPADAGTTVGAAAICIDDYMLAYITAQPPHA